MAESTRYRTARTARPSAPLWTRRAFPLLLVCVLAWHILSHAAADLSSARDPRAALFWDGANPIALTSLTQHELNNSGAAHWRAAAEHASDILSADPLAPGALSLYGAAVARLGETERAEKIMRVAAKHLAIDLIAHAWLYDHAVEKGNLFAALAELDTLLRGRPSLIPKIAPSVQALLARSAPAETAFARLLETAPPWRGSLLTYLSRSIDDPHLLIRLFGWLQASAARPSWAELRSYLDRLASEGLYDEAYLAWLVHLPPERLSQLGLLYNSRFQYPITNLPFDWTFASIDGASIAVVEDEKGPALSVEFYGARVSFKHVAHLLMLSPGEYSFSGLARADDLESERGLRWRINCAGRNGELLATTELLSKTTPWRAFGMNFSVPSAGCAVQWLLLEIPARVALEADVSGRVRYVNLTIDNIAK